MVHAPARRCPLVGLLLLAIWTLPALADGKFFAIHAAAEHPTIPAQRAVIAWDEPVQTLSIDTAFTADGSDFAWLVPLPAEPRIDPTTTGVFETAAALTAPRITRRSGALPWTTLAVIVWFMAFLFLLARNQRIGCLALLFGVPVLAVLMVPAIGTVRSSASSPGVEIRSRTTAGVYDTAVLRAERADELLAWLDREGFAAPDGVEPVMQSYLDRGWVFAAAKVRSDAPGGEQRAHPLTFRFECERPVYPMALTAVGNTPIRLDLFVFADGTASADGLRAGCSLPVVRVRPDQGAEGFGGRVRDGSGRARVAHEGLAAVSGTGGVLTRLTGTLSPDEQRSDLWIRVGPTRTHDPEYFLPMEEWARGFSAAAWVGAILLTGLALARGFGAITRERGMTLGGRALLVMLGAGLVAGAALPVYRGEVTMGPPGHFVARQTEMIGEIAALRAEERGVIDGPGLRAIVEEMVADSGLLDDRADPPLAEGDGPLSYRLEEDAGVWWYVWRDAAGGARRIRLSALQDD